MARLRRRRVKGSAVEWVCAEDVEHETTINGITTKHTEHRRLSARFAIKESADQFLELAKKNGHPNAYLESIPGYEWVNDAGAFA